MAGAQPRRTRIVDVVRSCRMPDSDLITIGNYTFLPEAELAQGILDDVGIESVLLDDNVGRMLSWIAVGGFRLQVNKADADAARKVLTAMTETKSSEQ